MRWGSWWWLAASSWQWTHSYIPSHADFWETSNHPGDSAPLQLKFGALWLLAFPKIKVTFEREEISDHWWNSGKLDRVADGDGRTVWGPKVPTLQGTEASMSYVRCFLYLVSSSTNVSISHITWLDTFWTELVYFPLQCDLAATPSSGSFFHHPENWGWLCDLALPNETSTNMTQKLEKHLCTGNLPSLLLVLGPRLWRNLSCLT